MPYLEIQLPSGHRDEVEVNNNSLLISVLEEICIKRHLDTDYCYLMHNKMNLDLSSKFGMSNLTNNSKLELLISSESLTNKVILNITLQFTNNIRVTNTFTPRDSLWSIILRFAESDENASIIFPKNSNLIPVIYHLHDLIIGEYCLKNTTLASLGFRSGQALFRFENKDIPEDEIESCNQILQKKLNRFSQIESCQINEEKQAKRGRRKRVAEEKKQKDLPVFYKTGDEIARLVELMNAANEFKYLDEEKRKMVIDLFRKVIVEKEGQVIVPGDDGPDFYIIEEGEFDIQVDGVRYSHHVYPDTFGMYDNPRDPYLVISITKGILWAINLKTCKQITRKENKQTEVAVEDDSALKFVNELEEGDDLGEPEIENKDDSLPVAKRFAQPNNLTNLEEMIKINNQ